MISLWSVAVLGVAGDYSPSRAQGARGVPARPVVAGQTGRPRPSRPCTPRMSGMNTVAPHPVVPGGPAPELPPHLRDSARDEASLKRFLHGLPGVDPVGVEQRSAGLATRSI